MISPFLTKLIEDDMFEYITDILEKENLILLTTQINLKEVQNFIRASPELLI